MDTVAPATPVALIPVVIPEIVTVKDFSARLNLPVSKVITELMKNGILATINEEIDFETASVIASDLGFEAKAEEAESSTTLTLEKMISLCADEKKSDRTLEERPPIVTILGHVDHGKTTLLDTIRKANVVASEAGGITQKISAYQVKKHGKLITFIDTPGHEAFSAMRHRGFSIADIAILVVAADDGVRPQTKEVIAFLKERKLPVIVAINKIDKPDANPERVKQELAEHGILFEGWGGDVMSAEISAKQGTGVDKLLDSILLLSEVENFRADAKRDGLAVVLESNLDPQKGPVAVVLDRTGTIKVGQDIVAGVATGRIRRLEDFAGREIKQVTPSMPAIVYGFESVPQVNDVLQVANGKISARLRSRENSGGIKRITSDKEDGVKRLAIIIKADVQGSLEAIEQILLSIEHPEVAIEEISSGVGAITESDVKSAEAANALIIGFNVTPTAVAKRLAENKKVTIETYAIIYKLVEDVKNRLAAMLPPEIVRTDFGRLSVLAIFKTGKHDQIVGGRVTEGKIVRGTMLEVKRDDEIVATGKMGNLQQNKQNADEVTQSNECGLVFESPVRIQVGDTLVCFKEEEKKRTL